MTEIIAYSRDYCIDIMGVSTPGFNRYLREIAEILGDDFPYEKYSKSVSKEALDILILYRELVRKFNVSHARKHLAQECLNYGYITQKTDRTDHRDQPRNESATDFDFRIYE